MSQCGEKSTGGKGDDRTSEVKGKKGTGKVQGENMEGKGSDNRDVSGGEGINASFKAVNNSEKELERRNILYTKRNELRPI